MLRSHRVVVVPALAARVSTHALLHPRFRLHAVWNEQVVCDDAVALRSFTRRGFIRRPIVTALLGGAARVRAHDRDVWLAPGDVLAMDAKDAIVMRQEGPRYAALAFEWDPAWLGARPEALAVARPGAGALETLERAFDAIVAGAAGASDVVRVVEVLHAAGLAPAPPDAASCVDEEAGKSVELSRALDDLLSRLDDQPMLADLERRLGVSPRQLNRLVAAFNERYGFNAGGWRDARNRRRLFVGVALMTAPGAKAEAVAQHVGYRSLPAFTAALTAAGLPSSSAIAPLVASLGVR